MLVKKDQDQSENGRPGSTFTNGRGSNNRKSVEAVDSSSSAASPQAST